MSEKPYKPADIEVRVQQQWEDTDAFRVDENAEGEKYYCLSIHNVLCRLRRPLNFQDHQHVFLIHPAHRVFYHQG